MLDGLGESGRGVWSEEQRSWHINRLELLAVFLALRQFLLQLTGCHVLIRKDNMMVVSYLNRQEGLRSRPLYKLARSVPNSCQSEQSYIPSHLSSGADLLSRQRLEDGEWKLNPQVVNIIRQRFGRAEVDLFASRSGCFGSTGSIWLPPVVLLRVRSDSVEHLLLVAPWWPTQSWFSDLISLSVGPPWEIPLRHHLLTQAWGTIWHPRPDLWKLWVWPLSRMG